MIVVDRDSTNRKFPRRVWSSPFERACKHRCENVYMMPFGTDCHLLKDKLKPGLKVHERGMKSLIIGYDKKTTHGILYKVVSADTLQEAGKVSLIDRGTRSSCMASTPSGRNTYKTVFKYTFTACEVEAEVFNN